MFDIKTLKTLPSLFLPNTNSEQLTYLNETQIILNNYYSFLENCWWLIFIIVLMSVFYIAYKKSLFTLTIDQLNFTEENKNNVSYYYKKIFFLYEIENSRTLQLFGGALLLSYLKTFSFWMGDPSTTLSGIHTGQSICWPFFQSCQKFIFLERTPNGYSQPIAYMILYSCILLSAYGLLTKKIILAHVCSLILFIWAIYTILISYEYNYAANYTYYLITFSFVFLFCSYKNFFACLSIVLFYFLSTTSKISDTWILGTYFTSLELGLPLFSKNITPILTNFIIFMEMVGAWFLFSKQKILQRSILIFFIIFHIYSGILVSYHYPTIVLPSVLLLFGPLFTPFEKIPNIRSAFIGWILVVTLFTLQSISILIPGDRRLTMEGNFYGLFMYEANHQCVSTVRLKDIIIQSVKDANANHRCDPYKIMKKSQNSFCLGNTQTKYTLEILHSINGGPFYQIVNESNLCDLQYKPFTHNEWIKTKTTAPALFRPAENYNY